LNDEALIIQAQAASVVAWNAGDLPAHLAIYDPSVTMMTGTGPRQGIAPIEAAFRSRYFHNEASRPVLRTEQVVVRRLSAECALMTGRYRLSEADAAEHSGWFSLVWLRTAVGWRAIHDHSS
jgi:ketosteroid isomerase-like protein